MGRWISRDPAEEAGGLHLYAYVENEVTAYIDPLGTTPYTYRTGKPCGAYRICETTVDLRKHNDKDQYQDAGMDVTKVVGFEVTFLPQHTEDATGFRECCETCCNGGLRVIQAISVSLLESAASVGEPKIDDPRGDVKGKNRKTPKGCPPPGYVRGGGGMKGKGGKYSHCDAPLGAGLRPGSYGNINEDFEVCAMCKHGTPGSDVLFGCASFSWFEGTAEENWKDRGLKNVGGYTKSTHNGKTCYTINAGAMGDTFRKALERWNRLAGSER